MSDCTRIIGEHLQRSVAFAIQQLAIARQIKHSRKLVKAALNLLPDEQKRERNRRNWPALARTAGPVPELQILAKDVSLAECRRSRRAVG